MHESSDLQFFENITGSVPGIFNESRLFMTFLTSLGVTRIFYIFKVVPEAKEGKQIPKSSILEFLKKISADNFALSDPENNTSGRLNIGGNSTLTFNENIVSNGSQVSGKG